MPIRPQTRRLLRVSHVIQRVPAHKPTSLLHNTQSTLLNMTDQNLRKRQAWNEQRRAALQDALERGLLPRLLLELRGKLAGEARERVAAAAADRLWESASVAPLKVPCDTVQVQGKGGTQITHIKKDSKCRERRKLRRLHPNYLT